LIAKISLVDYVSGGAPTSRIWPIRNFRPHEGCYPQGRHCWETGSGFTI